MNSGSAYNVGQQAGAFAVAALFLALALKLLKSRTRPDVNLKCLWSLLLTLLLFAGASVVRLASGLMQENQRAASIATGGFMLVGMIVAAVLAIQGLFELRRATERRHGAKYSFWTLALFAIIAFSGVAGVKRARAASPLRPLPFATLAGYPIFMTNLNFRFTAPQKPWVQMDAKRFNKDAALVFMRHNPQVLCFIIAEQASGVDLSAEALVEIAQGQVRSGLENGEVTEPRGRTINGVHGALFDETGLVQGKRLHGVHWCAATNGYLYQVIIRGVDVDGAAVQRMAEPLLSGFSLMDPTREAASAFSAIGVYQSLPFHYSLGLSNTAWKAHPDKNKELPGSDLVALLRAKCILGVIPLYLHGFDPSPEVLASGLASRFNLVFPHQDASDIERTDDQLTFSHRKMLDGDPYSFRCRIVKRNGFAYLMAGWWPAEGDDFRQAVEEAFSRLSIHNPASNAPIAGAGELFGISPESLLPEMRVGQGEVFNWMGLALLKEKQIARALEFFRLARTYDPSERTYLENALYCFEASQENAAALLYLEKNAGAFANDSKIQGYKALFLGGSGSIEPAMELYEMIFQGGYRSDEQFTEYLDLLAEHGRNDTALERLENYLHNHDSLDLRLYQARLLARIGKPEKAIEILLTARKKNLYNSELELALASAQIAAEKPSEALETINAVIRRGNTGAYVQTMKGEAQLALKLFREARTSFEQAAKLEPQNKEVQSYLDYVNALLGQGQNYSIKERIEPVDSPRAVLEKIDTRKAEGEAKEFGAFYEYDLTAVDFKKDKHRKATRSFRVRVTDQSGVSSFSVLQVPFDPISEALFVNELTVMDKDGKIIGRGDPDQYYVIDAPSILASYDKLVNLPVPSLQPGVTIQATITTRALATPKRFRFMSHSMGNGLPTALSVFRLSGDIAQVAVQSPEKDALVPGGEARMWRMENPPVSRWEVLQPTLAELYPPLYLGPKGTDWNTVVADYLKEITDKLAPEEKVRQFALEKTKGLSREADKIDALCAAVQRIRYKAIEFGTRGTIPNNAAKTLEQGFGDCKDSAVLLRALLAEVGVEAKLAMVRPGKKIIREMPSLDQFTHVILYLPKHQIFLDPTEKSLRLTTVTPLSLLDSDALILDAVKPEFVSITASKGAENRVAVERKAKILEDNTIEIEETATFHGYAAQLRDSFAELPLLERRAVLQRIVARHAPHMELCEWNGENIEDPTKSLRFTCRYRLKTRGTAPISHEIRIPTIWEKLYLAADKSSQRRTPFELKFPTELQSATIISFPKNWKLSKRAEPYKHNDKLVSAQCTPALNEEANELSFTTKVQIISGIFPAEQYERYVDGLQESSRIIEPEFVFKTDAPL